MLFESYGDWMKAVKSNFNRFDACFGYLNESGERRRTEFGLLFATAQCFSTAGDLVAHLRDSGDIYKFKVAMPAIRQLEQLARKEQQQ